MTTDRTIASTGRIDRMARVPDRPDPACLAMPGQRVMTAAGVPAIVAYTQAGIVWAWVGRGAVPRPVIVRADAWGGEHDMHAGMAA